MKTMDWRLNAIASSIANPANPINIELVPRHKQIYLHTTVAEPSLIPVNIDHQNKDSIASHAIVMKHGLMIGDAMQ